MTDMETMRRELVRLRKGLTRLQMAVGGLAPPSATAAIGECFGALATLEQAAGVVDQRAGVRPVMRPGHETAPQPKRSA